MWSCNQRHFVGKWLKQFVCCQGFLSIHKQINWLIVSALKIWVSFVLIWTHDLRFSVLREEFSDDYGKTVFDWIQSLFSCNSISRCLMGFGVTFFPHRSVQLNLKWQEKRGKYPSLPITHKQYGAWCLLNRQRFTLCLSQVSPSAPELNNRREPQGLTPCKLYIILYKIKCHTWYVQWWWSSVTGLTNKCALFINSLYVMWPSVYSLLLHVQLQGA